jgi:hypothetical protein
VDEGEILALLLEDADELRRRRTAIIRGGGQTLAPGCGGARARSARRSGAGSGRRVQVAGGGLRERAHAWKSPEVRGTAAYVDSASGGGGSKDSG